MTIISNVSQKVSLVLAASAVAVGISVVGAPIADAAATLGGANVTGYCNSVKGTPSLRLDNSAYGWRCATWYGYESVDMNAVCRWQYGQGAYAGLVNNTWTGWRCYR